MLSFADCSRASPNTDRPALGAGLLLLLAQVSAQGGSLTLGARAEHGVDGVAVIVQGRLVSGNRIIEAGLVCLPRLPKPVAEIAAS